MIPSGTSPTEIIYQEEGKDQIELATQSRKPVELSEFETRTAPKLLQSDGKLTIAAAPKRLTRKQGKRLTVRVVVHSALAY